MVTLSKPFPVLQHMQSSYRHLWFTLQTKFESFNQGNFSQIKTGRTKALLDSLRSIKNCWLEVALESSSRLTSILEWNGLDDSTNTLKLEAAAIFGLLSISEDHTVYTLLWEGLPLAIIDSITAITRDSPIGLILPYQSSTQQTEHHLLRIAQETDCKELKDNTSNNDLERDFTQEPEAFTISQDDELDKASQSLSIDAKPNRKKSSGHVISKLKKLILNHYQPSIIQK
ncbi:hypothetical protein PPACK8108_LOCUS11000 [Phakopsora pachyrhizi]|uniref:Uncharacterized protein n=1 Tax=Phakopsora pachyrhizi TaxID=170000 RepID=A0AAV0B260_PHAPC|nr:hypothetical protein PPACK8108_LOCUS11000 [Phakopsora pachyrhizi]